MASAPKRSPKHSSNHSSYGARPDLEDVDCRIRSTTGYRRGKPIPLELVRIDGDAIERQTASAFAAMRVAALHDGVRLSIRSGFRDMQAQRWLYRCYTTCSCNGCTKAAKPGHSKHQSGRALDINLSSGEVHPWLLEHAGDYGFVATVRGEPWHWVYQGNHTFPDVCTAET